MQGASRLSRSIQGALASLLLCVTVTAQSAPPRHTPSSTAATRAEVTRGAADVAAVVAQKHPYELTRATIHNLIERRTQESRDSNAYLFGAHLAAALWIEQLSGDLSWRDAALAQHRDIVRWLRPQVELSDDEIARVVTQAQHLDPPSEPRVLERLRAILR